MSTIEINFKLDPSDTTSLLALSDFFKALISTGGVKFEAPKFLEGIKTEVVKDAEVSTSTTKEIKSKAKSVKPPKEETAPEETAPEETAPEETAPEETAPEETAPEQGSITPEYLREVLQEKVKGENGFDNKEKIKSKLTELGAPNVTKLDPSKYPAMLEFLNTL